MFCWEGVPAAEQALYWAGRRVINVSIDSASGVSLPAMVPGVRCRPWPASQAGCIPGNFRATAA